MRLIFTIGFLGILCTSVLGQKLRKPFESTDFQNIELSDSWIVVKYNTLPHKGLPQEAKPILEQRSSSSTGKNLKQTSVLDGIVRIPLKKGENPLVVCNQYLKDPNIRYAEPIILDQPLESVSDPLSESQYHLDIIQVFDAWDVTTGDDDITIGIIDTGIDLDHEDLTDKIWINEDDPVDGVDNDGNGYIDDYYGYDFADEDNDPDADESVHGARVAGIAGASTNNEVGIAGIGYNTKIAALKGFESGSGFSRGLFDAILYAADNGIDILNLSWGSIRRPLQSEQDIIDYAVLEKDVVVVAAAGNDGGKTSEESKFYPASYEHVLSVAGSNSSDEKWSGSSFNFLVDITAPGAAIVSTSSGNEYNTSGGYGTSFAAPMVAAAAALVKDQFPELSALQIMERVRATADDIYETGSNSQYDGKLGKGRLNVYRAVTESSVKSIRAENPELISSNGEYVFYGDTVTATFQLTNFLTRVNNPAIYINSVEEEFEVSQGSFFPGFMATLDEQEISFEVVLSDDLEPESTVGIRLDISDGSYSDFQYLDVTTSPDYVDFGNENITLTIEGKGGLGEGNDAFGPGLVYQGDTLLNFSGIMLATSDASVSDNIISNFTELESEDDFSVDQYYKLAHHPSAFHFGYSEFLDASHSLKVEQSNIAPESGDFLIIRYRIVNESATSLSNLSFGLYTDWDLGDYLQNYAAFNESESYLYTRNSTSDLFSGSKVIGDGTQTFSSLDIDSQNGNDADLSESFSDAEKFDFLINQSQTTAGAVGAGNDVAGIHGLAIDQLDGYSDTYVNVIFGVGTSLSELESVFASAEEYLEKVINNPRVLEVFYTCDGANVTLDPSDGDAFEFYEDPLGNTLLASGSSYATGTITEDTVYYAKNMDENYPSDIFELRVQLLNDFADFSIASDTLYLDDSSVTFQFTDQSINASSWSWDFGQGSFSSLENPILSVNSVGSYTVTVEVENEQGCLDTVSKDIVVANRPENLSFDDYQICPGESITISESSTSKLKVYTDPDQSIPIMEGASLDLGPFFSDTTLYISGIIDGLETSKSSIQIDTYSVDADFFFVSDSSSADHQINLVAEVPEDASLLWRVNEVEMGSDSYISVTTDETHIDATLEVTSTEGCAINIEKSFTVSTSATPAISDAMGCFGDTLIITPSNGEIFGFYNDAELTSLIKKGKQLSVAEEAKFYVVGLDDGLPGSAIEVDVSFVDFSSHIVYESSVIADKNRVELAVESSLEITTTNWYVNEALVETAPTPILFFDDTLVTIVVEATSSEGCMNSDSLTLDFTPPLGGLSDHGIAVYPNPIGEVLHLQVGEKILSIELSDLSGQLVQNLDPNLSQFNLEHLHPGLYILTLKRSDGAIRVKLLKE